MASRGINKVILIGHLGQDPEVRYMPNGGAVANITVATSENWRDKTTNEQKEKTEWHRVVLFGKVAEIAGEYLRKGSQIYIEGSLQTRKWTDQVGGEKYTTEVVVNVGGTMQMLGARQSGSVTTSSSGQSCLVQSSKLKRNNTFNVEQKDCTEKNNIPIVSKNEFPIDFDDDIPF